MLTRQKDLPASSATTMKKSSPFFLLNFEDVFACMH